MAESFELLSTFICLFFSYPLTLPSMSIFIPLSILFHLSVYYLPLCICWWLLRRSRKHEDPKHFRVSHLSFFYVCSRSYISHQFLRLCCLFICLCLLVRIFRKVKLCLSRYLFQSVKRSVVIDWVTWYWPTWSFTSAVSAFIYISFDLFFYVCLYPIPTSHSFSLFFYLPLLFFHNIIPSLITDLLKNLLHYSFLPHITRSSLKLINFFDK